MKRLLTSLIVFALWGAFGVCSELAQAETTRLPSTRDLWVSSSGGEEQANNGATPRLKVKGYQEYSIIDVDASSLLGKEIVKATLHLKTVGDERLYRIGVSSLTAEWVEGSGTSYAKNDGESSFRWRINPNIPWYNSNVSNEKGNGEYCDMTSVMFGEGGSFWSHADTTDPDEDGWQTVEVDPNLIAARAAGLSYGFVVFDDTGTELERNGDDVKVRLFPNRFFYSHDQNRACEPYFEVEYRDAQSVALPQPKKLIADSKGLDLGAVALSWTCDAASVLGFIATLDGERVPQYLIPTPSADRYEVRLTGVDPQKSHTFSVCAVGFSGEKGKETSLKFKPAQKAYDEWNTIVDVKKNAKKAASKKANAKLGAAGVAVVDEFVKITEKGEFVPPVAKDYLNSNAIWSADNCQIDLASAKNEFIGFQIVFSNDKPVDAKFSLKWDDAKNKSQVSFYRFTRVNTPNGKMVDPAIPFDGAKGVSIREGVDSVYCELFIPGDVAAGVKTGKLQIVDGSGKALDLNIKLNVWNFALPNELCFLPEMNCYSLPSNEREYYRLAQVHRTYINRVPYSHRGSVGDGLAPKWDSKTRTFDWTDWEKRFAQYFDGSAFADLPRGAVPIEAFYLPLFENFPGNVFEGFQGVNTWPDVNAFTEEYREDFAQGCKGFAKEISKSKWNSTKFFFFLNNKLDYKKNGWSKASSPWLLDEPASYRDFAALQFFGEQLNKALTEENLVGTMLYRADVSRPQWERDSLQGLLDVYVVGGGSFRDYNRMSRARKGSIGPRFVYAYGTTSAPHESAYQPIFWSLEAWSTGADGIVPWQTIGNDDSWKNGDELSLFYPATKESNGQVVPSIRLKSYRRGEQDVEYLTILQKQTERPREEIAQAVRDRLNLGEVKSRVEYAEDAGTAVYKGVSPDEHEIFRREVGEFLNRSLSKEEK